jgi:hypothetical protein
MSDYLPARELHDHEHKVRLTEDDDRTLRDLARRNRLPPAVLIRVLVAHGLSAAVGLPAVEQTVGRSRRV